MKKNKTIITGIGAVTPFGLGVDALWTSTLNSVSCSKSGLGVIDSSIIKDNKTIFMTLCSIKEAMNNAKWDSLTEHDGLIIASTTGLTTSWENDLMLYLKNNSRDNFPSFKNEPLGIFLSTICNKLNFRGRSLLLSTACSASTQALGIASQWIKQNKVKRCIVVGTETICTLTHKGFGCFNLISESPCRPFDKNRNGINISEGSASICLESFATTKTKPLSYIMGSGFSSDAYHMTAPKPTGEITARAMDDAIKSSNIDKKDISWVHAHGTGSVHNDLAESKAIAQVFNNIECPPVTSTKYVHGHMLGASGILETVLCIKALNNDTILATPGLLEPDPELPINHAKHTNTKIKNILKSTLGFGGINAAIVIGNTNE